MKPEEFATKKFPLRSSKLPALSQCTLMTVQSMLNEEEVGQPANTGSATHKAIEIWHKQKVKDEQQAIDGMVEGSSKYPLADFVDAAAMFRSYIKDPRNKEAEIILIEEKVEIELEPSPIDKTKQPIIIIGTLDQVRLWDGRLSLWDVKTGSKSVEYMKAIYSLQLAAYCLGASKKLKKEVHPGGFIRTRGYLRKRPPVDPESCPPDIFIDVKWKSSGIHSLLEIIRQKVALVRMGLYSITPSENCSYCKIGLDNCPEILQQLTLKHKQGNRKRGKEKDSGRNESINSVSPYGNNGNLTDFT